MSRFDEEPDGDVHGECAAEIHKLQATIDQLQARNAELVDALKFYADANHWSCDDDLKHSTIGAGDAYELAQEALSSTAESSAQWLESQKEL